MSISIKIFITMNIKLLTNIYIMNIMILNNRQRTIKK